MHERRQCCVHREKCSVSIRQADHKNDNRFELVLLAAKRARQLSTGGKDPLVEVESDKPTVLALREIAEGLITPDVMAREHELEAEEEFAASFETPVL